MSKASRKRKKSARDAMKKKKKQAAKAMYEAWRDQGLNTKSKRAQRNKILARKVRPFRNRKRTHPTVEVDSQENPGKTYTLTQKQYRNTLTLEKYLRN